MLVGGVVIADHVQVDVGWAAATVLRKSTNSVLVWRG
jgi:hypothetical protein